MLKICGTVRSSCPPPVTPLANPGGDQQGLEPCGEAALHCAYLPDPIAVDVPAMGPAQKICPGRRLSLADLSDGRGSGVLDPR